MSLSIAVYTAAWLPTKPHTLRLTMAEHKVCGVKNIPGASVCELADTSNPSKGIRVTMKFPKGFFHPDKESSDYPVVIKAEDVDTSSMGSGISSPNRKSFVWLCYVLYHHDVTMDIEFCLEKGCIVVNSAKVTSILYN